MYYTALRNRYDQRVTSKNKDEAKEQAVGCAIEICEQMGMGFDRFGRPSLVKERVLYPDQMSLKGLAVEFMGQQWFNQLGQAIGQGERRGLIAIETGGTAGILPGDLPQTSMFLATVAGMIQTAILDSYESPEYISRRLAEVKRTTSRQTQLLNISHADITVAARNPGDPYPRLSMTDNRVVTPETQQMALGVDVFYETVFFDSTGEVLDQANKVGDDLQEREDYDGIRCLLGVTNPYNFNGTSYNTFQTAGALWTNKNTSNPMNDFTCVAISQAMASRLVDPRTGRLITYNFDAVLCTPYRGPFARHILGVSSAGQNVEHRTASAAYVSHGPNQTKKTFEVLDSPRVSKILTDSVASGGLAMSQSDADNVYIFIATGRKSPLKLMQNWPLQIKVINSGSDYAQAERKIMMSAFADYMQVFTIGDPRGLQWNN